MTAYLGEDETASARAHQIADALLRALAITGAATVMINTDARGRTAGVETRIRYDRGSLAEMAPVPIPQEPPM